jgi:hypothetical protein
MTVGLSDFVVEVEKVKSPEGTDDPELANGADTGSEDPEGAVEDGRRRLMNDRISTSPCSS